MADLEKAREAARRIVDNIKTVIIGKDDAVELAVVALICQGHMLVEDVPGVGKTMLARSLARSTGCTFRRIQFTPDLLPSDITGVSIYNQKTQDFEFKDGPIISQLVLADEINRATPKTQSALLEAMEEGQVTIEGVTHELPRPFTVMATQNPIEYEGTFPLPEAQLDRFILRITLGYPTPEQELEIMRGQETAHPIESLEPVATADRDRRAAGRGQVGVRGRPDTAVHRVDHRLHPRARRPLAGQLAAGLARAVPRSAGHIAHPGA